MSRRPGSRWPLLVYLLTVSLGCCTVLSAEENPEALERAMDRNMSVLIDYYNVYIVLDDLAATATGRLQHFNPAAVPDLDDIVARGEYLHSLPDPLPPGSPLWASMQQAMPPPDAIDRNTPAVPAMQLSSTRSVLSTPSDYLAAQQRLKGQLPAVMQRIREIDRQLRQHRLDAVAPAVSDSASGEQGGVSADRMLQEAYASYREGDIDRAGRLFDQVAIMQPDTWRAYYGRGSVAAMNGAADAALADFDTALRYAPEEPNVLFSRAFVYLSLDDERKAIADLQRAFARGHALAGGVLRAKALHWEERGIAAFDNGSLEEARRCFDRVISIDPGYIDGYFNRGGVLQRLGQHESALRDFNTYIQLVRNYSDPPVMAANATLFGVGNAGHVPTLSQNIDENTQLGLGFFYLGYNQHQLRAYQLAVANYTAAINYHRIASPQSLSLTYHQRGMAYYALNDKKLAARDLNTACEFGRRESCENEARVKAELGLRE